MTKKFKLSYKNISKVKKIAYCIVCLIEEAFLIIFFFFFVILTSPHNWK